MKLDEPLCALLDYLNAESVTTPKIWEDWQLTPITGGANNLLYRATRSDRDYAVKFTVRDHRNRAGREYAALCAIEQAGLEIAPKSIGVNHVRFRQPVVVQTWLKGETLTDAPETNTDWMALLEHYCAIHSMTPSHTMIELQPAFLNCQSGIAGKRMVYQHLEKLPLAAYPAPLMALLARFETWTPAEWQPAPLALCRVDPNWRNFIRRPPGVLSWASVDWENSGWGDPAFEIADVMTHPSYETIPDSRWAWLIETYAEKRKDATAEMRIRTYETVMLMWWVIRWARYLYEIPRGLDPRLVQRPENWQEETERKANLYMSRLEAHLDSLSIFVPIRKTLTA